jgi:hypothetical protein
MYRKKRHPSHSVSRSVSKLCIPAFIRISCLHKSYSRPYQHPAFLSSSIRAGRRLYSWIQFFNVHFCTSTLFEKMVSIITKHCNNITATLRFPQCYYNVISGILFFTKKRTSCRSFLSGADSGSRSYRNAPLQTCITCPFTCLPISDARKRHALA